MLVLIGSEIAYFKDSRIYNKFVPDIYFNDKLKLAIDMTVAMQCAGNLNNYQNLKASPKGYATSFHVISFLTRHNYAFGVE